MKNPVRLCFAFLVLIFSACGTPEQRGENGFVYTIDIDAAVEAEEPPQSEIFESVRTIPLESAPEALLSRIDKVERVGDRIFILDRNSNLLGRMAGLIVEFDMEGRFVRRFGSVGRGPGEYNSVFTFAIDQEAGVLMLLDMRSSKIVSYDLESGKHVEDIQYDRQQGMWPFALAPIGGRIYLYPSFSDYDETKPMLISIEKDDPTVVNRYLPLGERLKGWTYLSLINRDFIYKVAGEWALYRDNYSNEIYRVTPEGVNDYILIESERMMGEREREIISEEYASQDISAPPTNSPWETLRKLDVYNELRDYFETDRHIFFTIGRGNSRHKFMYDKRSGETKRLTNPNFDLFFRADAPKEAVISPPNYLLADNEGIFYGTQSFYQLDWLRKAANEGVFVDGFDRLGELRELKEDSNPVLFYLKLK
jgi:hypothetical protein